MAKVYMDNYGASLILDCGMNITGATAITIEVLKPDMTTDSWDAAIYGTNYVLYALADGDLDVAGLYKVQVALTLGDWSGLGDTGEFHVHRAFG